MTLSSNWIDLKSKRLNWIIWGKDLWRLLGWNLFLSTFSGKYIDSDLSNYYSCSDLTDDLFNLLARGIHKLAGLRHLDLNFDSCLALTDNGLKHLKKCLENRHNKSFLQSLSLNFSRSVHSIGSNKLIIE